MKQPPKNVFSDEQYGEQHYEEGQESDSFITSSIEKEGRNSVYDYHDNRNSYSDQKVVSHIFQSEIIVILQIINKLKPAKQKNEPMKKISLAERKI